VFLFHESEILVWVRTRGKHAVELGDDETRRRSRKVAPQRGKKKGSCLSACVYIVQECTPRGNLPP
jgi:hypothetical protein